MLPHRGWPATVTLIDFSKRAQGLQSPERVSFGRLKGLPQGSGLISHPYPDFVVKAKRTLIGPLPAGDEHLLYVEGDRQFQATPTMTVAEFAEANAGKFFVLTVSVFR